VTDVVKPGSNDLEVEVRTTASGDGRGAPQSASGLIGPVRLSAR
jgi:hypothetical protein